MSQPKTSVTLTPFGILWELWEQGADPSFYRTPAVYAERGEYTISLDYWHGARDEHPHGRVAFSGDDPGALLRRAWTHWNDPKNDRATAPDLQEVSTEAHYLKPTISVRRACTKCGAESLVQAEGAGCTEWTPPKGRGGIGRRRCPGVYAAVVPLPDHSPLKCSYCGNESPTAYPGNDCKRKLPRGGICPGTFQ